MLPLHSQDVGHAPGFHIRAKIFGWIRSIFSNKTSRNLFLFLLLNLSFAFVELAYGIWTNSLGLISDSFHMFFDCTALLAGLAASVISRWRATQKFSYGYVRAEVLAGFVNGLFLVFIAFFIFSEAIERALEPPEVHHERLFLVSVLGFLVNLVGIFAFNHGHAHSHGGGKDHGHSHMNGLVGHSSHSKSQYGHGFNHDGEGNAVGLGMGDLDGKHAHSHGAGDDHSHSHGDHGHSHKSHGHSHASHDAHDAGAGSKILEGVFLHILADTLGSVGVIISSVLIYQFGWMIADPICSMFISILIAFSVYPLLRDSMGILMQRTPRELDRTLPGCYQRVTQLDDVFSIQETHFWTLCSDVYIGTVKLEVSPKADIRKILSQTHNIFTQIGIRQLYVQIDIAAM